MWHQMLIVIFLLTACEMPPHAPPTARTDTENATVSAVKPAPTPTPEVVCPENMFYIFGPTRCMDAIGQAWAVHSVAVAICAARSLSMCSQQDFWDAVNLGRNAVDYAQTSDPAPTNFTAMVVNGHPTHEEFQTEFSYRCCGVFYE